MIARVVPLTKTRAITGLYDYLLAPELVDRGVGVGSLLRVRFAGRTLSAVIAELAERSELPAQRLAVASELLDARLPAELVGLAVWLADEYCSTPARALEVLLAPGALRGVRERRLLIASLTAAGAEMTTGTLSLSPPLGPRQREALAVLAAGPRPAAELGTPLLRRLEARGLVSLERAAVPRQLPRFEVSSTASAPLPLTAEQQDALSEIRHALAHEPAGKAPLLLHGVTGSGKTEVYLQAAEAVLRAGRNVLVLVPEIALTPQALARFTARFGEIVAVMHSGMSDGRRYEEWSRLASGAARICVGARSAVFAPLSDIGLIVVDEEHESSYKHEGDPRYDARTVAAHRALEHGALLVYGSATPRPETVFGARRLLLTNRVDGGLMPAVEILDMRGLHNPLHPQARLALADCRREGGKAIVLLNRRGWSNFLSCGSCGRTWMCPHCEVALVLHRAGGYMACHHCGHRERVPDRCPDCGSVSLSRHGAGTERLEHELEQALGDEHFPIMRLDADAAGIDARARILERFQAAASGVLVGTQMVAKGHDFRDVGLGVVVDADQTLRFPDFRAEERTFALITQLAGRTGRGGQVPSAGGRVLVQTQDPTARAIRLAAGHDSETFVRGELRRRKALGYPPFATLVRIVCAAADADDARLAADALAQHVATLAPPPTVAVLGPAPLFALRGRARCQLVLKSADRGAVVAASRAAVDALGASGRHRRVRLSVDVDPQ